MPLEPRQHVALSADRFGTCFKFSHLILQPMVDLDLFCSTNGKLYIRCAEKTTLSLFKKHSCGIKKYQQFWDNLFYVKFNCGFSGITGHEQESDYSKSWQKSFDFKALDMLGDIFCFPVCMKSSSCSNPHYSWPASVSHYMSSHESCALTGQCFRALLVSWCTDAQDFMSKAVLDIILLLGWLSRLGGGVI